MTPVLPPEPAAVKAAREKFWAELRETGTVVIPTTVICIAAFESPDNAFAPYVVIPKGTWRVFTEGAHTAVYVVHQHIDGLRQPAVSVLDNETLEGIALPEIFT